MYIDLKKVWFLYPFLLVGLLLAVWQLDFISFDLIEIKKNSGIRYQIILWFIILFPFILFALSEHWRSQLIHKKILLVGLAGLLAGINYKVNVANIFFIIFALIAVYYAVMERKTYRFELISYLLISYFIVNGVSLLWTYNHSKGLSHLAHLLPFLLIPALFSLFKLNRKDFDLLLLVIFRSAILFIFISLCSRIIQMRFFQMPAMPESFLQKAESNGIEAYNVLFAWTNYVHPSYNAVFILLAVGIGWYYIAKKGVENRLSATEIVFLFVGSLLIVSLSGSRFMLVGWLAVNASGFIYSIRNHKKLLYAALVAYVVVLGIALTLFSDKISGFYSDPARICLYNSAFEAISENTWYGTGLGGMTHYINYKNPIFESLGLGPEFPHFHPHNQFLGDLMQTGIFGLVCVVVILIMLFYTSIKQRNALLFFFLVIMLLLMNIEMPLVYQKGIFYFTVIVSFLYKKNTNSITDNE